MPVELYFHPEVRTALDNGKPVIALESTLITHGLPKPDNIQVAQAMETAIREQGAVPATIAILEGQITVGLTPEQLVFLGSASNVRKCSRRDLPLAVARKENGATTVAGTMIVARWAGIRVFATGGIGGVHRGHHLRMHLRRSRKEEASKRLAHGPTVELIRSTLDSNIAALMPS